MAADLSINLTELEQLIEKYGYWGPGHPEHTVEDWKYEIVNNDTRLGYWGRVREKMAEQ